MKQISLLLIALGLTSTARAFDCSNSAGRIIESLIKVQYENADNLVQIQKPVRSKLVSDTIFRYDTDPSEPGATKKSSDDSLETYVSTVGLKVSSRHTKGVEEDGTATYSISLYRFHSTNNCIVKSIENLGVAK